MKILKFTMLQSKSDFFLKDQSWKQLYIFNQVTNALNMLK